MGGGKGIFRSEDMHLSKFLVTKDSAYKLIDSLGKSSCAHFLNMNKNSQAFKLTYAERIKICEEIDKDIMYATSFADVC